MDYQDIETCRNACMCALTKVIEVEAELFLVEWHTDPDYYSSLKEHTSELIKQLTGEINHWTEQLRKCRH